MTKFEHKHLPIELQQFLTKFDESAEVEITDYERYENIYEVDYRFNHPQLGRISRQVYIRVDKSKRMSDSEGCG